MLKLSYFQQSALMAMIKMLLINACPKLAIDILKLKIIDGDAIAFFAKVIRETYKQRLATKQRRCSFFKLIIVLIKDNIILAYDTIKTVPNLY